MIRTREQLEEPKIDPHDLIRIAKRQVQWLCQVASHTTRRTDSLLGLQDSVEQLMLCIGFFAVQCLADFDDTPHGPEVQMRIGIILNEGDVTVTVINVAFPVLP